MGSSHELVLPGVLYRLWPSSSLLRLSWQAFPMTRHRMHPAKARAVRRELRHGRRYQYPSQRRPQVAGTKHRAARQHLRPEETMIASAVLFILIVTGLLAIPGSVHVAAADPAADVVSTAPVVAVPVSFKVCEK